MLVFGSALYGSAEDVHDGDILNAGTNISVTKDETTKTITISTHGVATSAEVVAVKKTYKRTKQILLPIGTKLRITAQRSLTIRLESNKIPMTSSKTRRILRQIKMRLQPIQENQNNTDDITELKM